MVAVRHHLVTQPLRVGDRLLELRFAAERRLHGKDLRPVSVVVAHVPAHEAEFRAADALPLELVRDLLEAVERDHRLHGRLVLHGLLRHRAGHRLPGVTHAHLGPFGHVVEERLLLGALRERRHRAAVQLVLPICPRHAGVVGVGPFQPGEADGQVLVRALHLSVPREREGIRAVLQFGRKGIAVGHALDDGHPRAVGRLHPEERHVRPRASPHAVLLARLEQPEIAVRVHPVAVGSGLRAGKVGPDPHPLHVGGQALAGQAERRLAVFHGEGRLLARHVAVLPQDIDRQRGSLRHNSRNERDHRSHQVLHHILPFARFRAGAIIIP